jgi:transposase
VRNIPKSCAAVVILRRSEVAWLLKRHLNHLLPYIKHRLRNGLTAGMKSKIQHLKSAARGFRSFANYRIRILFFCGKLSLYPQ